MSDEGWNWPKREYGKVNVKQPFKTHEIEKESGCFNRRKSRNLTLTMAMMEMSLKKKSECWRR
jgi:hypothetical protein